MKASARLGGFFPGEKVFSKKKIFSFFLRRVGYITYNSLKKKKNFFYISRSRSVLRLKIYTEL